MHFISNDQTVRSNTAHNLKEFNSQSLAIHAKKGERLVSMMPANEKDFEFLGDDIVELSTEKESLRSKIGPFDEKWLEESEAKLLKQIDDEKRANINIAGMQKQRERLK